MSYEDLLVISSFILPLKFYSTILLFIFVLYELRFLPYDVFLVFSSLFILSLILLLCFLVLLILNLKNFLLILSIIYFSSVLTFTLFWNVDCGVFIFPSIHNVMILVDIRLFNLFDLLYSCNDMCMWDVSDLALLYLLDSFGH